MLVYGGFDNEDRDDFWTLNLDSHNWKCIEIEGPHPPRKFHSLTVVGKNAYVFGGCIEKYQNKKY